LLNSYPYRYITSAKVNFMVLKNLKIKKILLGFSFIALVFNINAQTTIVDSIISGGIYRSYRLYVPAIYNASNPPCPLILNLHGYGSDALSQQYYGNFMPVADTANFLVVHPQGTNYYGYFWNAGIVSSGVDDIGFLSNLIDSIKSQYNIDLNRVYSTGMSNGGFMSYTLACALSNRIAAIASVAGSIFDTQYATCNPGRAVPVMQISGTADNIVPYNGDTTNNYYGVLIMEPIDTIVKYWVNNNGCDPTPVFSSVPDIVTTDGCTADHYVYNNGNLGSTVELFKIIGGGHTWPGSDTLIGVTNKDFNASVEIWRFFRKYTLTQFIGINEILSLNEKILIYPNPAINELIIQNENGFFNTNMDIFSVEGKLMCSQILNGNKVKFDISIFPSGMYLLKTRGVLKVTVSKFIKE